MEKSSSFRLISLNCEGVKNKLPNIRSLCDDADLIFLQETWLMPHETNMLNNIHEDFSSISISAVDVQSSVLTGRPYGGLSILYRKHLNLVGKFVNFDDTRLMGYQVLFNNFTYLFLNVYMPYYCEDNIAEFTMYVGKIESILEANEMNGLVIIGDFNAHPGKEYFNQLKHLCNEYDLIISDVENLPIDTFTHVNNSSLSKSWLDHCIMSPSLHNAVTNVHVDNDASISDHFPLYVTIDFHNLPKGITETAFRLDNINWDFDDREKSDKLFAELSKDFDFHSVYDFCFCNHSCQNVLHWVSIESTWSKFVRAVLQTGHKVFGTKKPWRKTIPGWNDHVRDLYMRSRDALKHWRRCGSPRHGEDAVAMRTARAAFKHAIRRCRLQEEALRADAISRKLASGDTKAFWRGVANSNGRSVRPDRIDGAVGEEDVARLWANKFSSTLNSVKDSHMKKEFVKKYDSIDDTEIPHVAVKEVQSVLKKLKSGKSVGLDGIPNEFYRSCKHQVTIFLSIMCNAFFIHEFIPESIMDGKIIPLLKGKLLDISSSDNYRPITISSSFSKILEYLMHNRIIGHLTCEDNQFGYKDKSSTDQCIFTLKSVVDYYHSLGSPVFACYVDVKAAFDRVSYWKMFSLLLQRGVPKKLVGILRFWYTNQSLCAAWGKKLSYRFHMGNGIKQGALLSPYLFNIYVESLNTMLNESKLGCCIANNPMNNLSWADDLVLLAPSSHALVGMLKVCDVFAEDHMMTYNTKKTKCMLFKNKNSKIVEIPVIRLSGRPLCFVDEFTYLGHIISSDRSDDADIMSQNRKLCARGNMIIRKFKFCSMDTKCTLFRAFCCGIYGMALWHRYKASSLNRLRVNYNGIMRRLANRPPWSSASELFVQMGVKGFYEVRRSACHSLSTRLQHSSNSLVQQLLHSDAYWRSPLRHHWNTLLHARPVD